MKKLVLERDALKNNIDVIRERAGSAVIYGVLTGDGYGAGAVDLARLLREEGIVRFAVGEAAEAAALRKAGFVEEEILMLRSTTDREELEQLIDLNVVCTSAPTLPSTRCSACSRMAQVLIKITSASASLSVKP